MTLRVTVVGATGLVGAELIGLLAERAFPLESLRRIASQRSRDAAAPRTAEGLELLAPDSFTGCDVAFFCTPAAVSREWVPRALAAGALVIDSSSAFRSDPAVPLVVPEVNPGEIGPDRRLLANPNCSTILLVTVLHPLTRLAGLRRVVVCTYQSVSGAGRRGVLALEAELAGSDPDVITGAFQAPIAANLIPFIGPPAGAGMGAEERKLRDETRRILGLDDLRVSATCVRVPVRRAHSEAVHLEFDQDVDPELARRTLAAAPGVLVCDQPEQAILPTPLRAQGQDPVLVGRIRADDGVRGGLALFLAGDQLRKGAALNAIQIAELACA